MNNSNLATKVAAIKELSKNTKVLGKPRVMNVTSSDNLSKSIRTKKDAQAFINELKSTIKNNS